MAGYQIELKRDDLSQWRRVEIAPEAGPGEIVVRLDLAALTSNNVTYAVHGGPPLHYFNFFPASDPEWGVVPVWGFATVVESGLREIGAGSRYFGYWPSATHLKLQPAKFRAGGFVDTTPHRLGMAPVYNAYRPAGSFPSSMEALVALFQPLYGTGHVLAGSLEKEVAAGLTILLTSASSKTALSTAFNLKKMGARLVGLTSPGNRAFVEKTGYYSEILSYDEIDGLNPDERSVLIDFTGNAALQKRLHQALPNLQSSIVVGHTDWDSSADAGPLPGPAPSFFFAPTHWEEQARSMGPAEFETALADSMKSFMESAGGWLETHEVSGVDGYTKAFADLMQNQAPANEGLIWRP